MSEESGEEVFFCNRERKGIECFKNSCYIDSLLMGLFYTTRTFDNCILVRELQGEFANFIQNELRKIVYKIRTPPFDCPYRFVLQLRQRLSEIEWRVMGDLMDVEHFLSLLLGPSALQLNPFLRYTMGKNYYHQILPSKYFGSLPEDRCVQRLVNSSMGNLGLKLKSLESGFIVKMPVSNGELKGMEYIVPNLSLNLSHCAENGSDYSELELLAVLCFQSAHYTTYMRCMSEDCATQWLYFDSFGPRVTVVPELEIIIRTAEETPSSASALADSCSEFKHLISHIIICIYALKSDVIHLEQHSHTELTQRSLAQTKDPSWTGECNNESENDGQKSGFAYFEQVYHDSIASIREVVCTKSISYQQNLQKFSKTVKEVGSTFKRKLLTENNDAAPAGYASSTDTRNSGLQAILYAMLAHTNIFDEHLLTRNYSDWNYGESDYDDVSIRSMLQATADNLRRRSSKADFDVIRKQVQELRYQLECRAKSGRFHADVAEVIRVLFHISLKTRPFIKDQEEFLYRLQRAPSQKCGTAPEYLQNILAESMKRKKVKFQNVPYPALIICRSLNSCEVVPNITINLDSSILVGQTKELTLLAVVCKKPDGAHFVYVRKPGHAGTDTSWIKFDPSTSSELAQPQVSTVVKLEQDLEMLSHPGMTLKYKPDIQAILESAYVYIYYPEGEHLSRRVVYSTAV